MSVHNNNENLAPGEQQLQAALRGLGEVRADDSFREQLRGRFVSGDIAADAPAEVVALPARTRRRRALWAIPAAAVAMAASLAVIFLGDGGQAWQLLHVRGEGTVVVNGVAAEAVDQAALARLVAAEARLVVPAGVELDVVLDGVMVAGAAGPADFTLPARPAKDPYVYQATVRAGDFRVTTGPEFPGREIVLLTTEGRVEITGTTVAVYKNEEVTCVCVLEGTAQVGRDHDHLDPVPAGMRKVMFADGREPVIIPIEPTHEQGLRDFAAFNHDTFR